MYLNEHGEVEKFRRNKLLGKRQTLFGNKVYKDIDEKLTEAVETLTEQQDTIK